jgi:hypothetical protein
MLIHIVLIMFVIMMVAKVLAPVEVTKTNLTFNMAVLTLMLVFTNMCRNTFPAGYFKLRDETQIQLLFALKSFVLIWCGLSYTEGAVADFFGLNVDKSHQTFERRLNEIVSLTGGSLKLAPEMTYATLALLGAFISFVTMQSSVNFSFYGFAMLRTASRDQSSSYLESMGAGRVYSFKTLVKLIYANFLTPVFIVLLFCKEVFAVPLESVGVDT